MIHIIKKLKAISDIAKNKINKIDPRPTILKDILRWDEQNGSILNFLDAKYGSLMILLVFCKRLLEYTIGLNQISNGIFNIMASITIMFIIIRVTIIFNALKKIYKYKEIRKHQSKLVIFCMFLVLASHSLTEDTEMVKGRTAAETLFKNSKDEVTKGLNWVKENPIASGIGGVIVAEEGIKKAGLTPPFELAMQKTSNLIREAQDPISKRTNEISKEIHDNTVLAEKVANDKKTFEDFKDSEIFLLNDHPTAMVKGGKAVAETVVKNGKEEIKRGVAWAKENPLSSGAGTIVISDDVAKKADLTPPTELAREAIGSVLKETKDAFYKKTDEIAKEIQDNKVQAEKDGEWFENELKKLEAADKVEKDKKAEETAREIANKKIQFEDDEK